MTLRVLRAMEDQGPRQPGVPPALSVKFPGDSLRGLHTVIQAVAST